MRVNWICTDSVVLMIINYTNLYSTVVGKDWTWSFNHRPSSRAHGLTDQPANHEPWTKTENPGKKASPKNKKAISMGSGTKEGGTVEGKRNQLFQAHMG